MEICIFLTALYLVIEDLRTKTVNVYVCILLFLLSTVYAVYFNVNGYLDNLLAGMLFLTFMYTSTMKLKKADYVPAKTEYTPVENVSEGLPYLPFVFSGFALYILFDLENHFAAFIRNVQISVDFLAVPLCICLCFVIFIQVIRHYLNRDKIVILKMGDGDIWAIGAVIGFFSVGEFFIIMFLANIIYIIFYIIRRLNYARRQNTGI